MNMNVCVFFSFLHSLLILSLPYLLSFHFISFHFIFQNHLLLHSNSNSNSNKCTYTNTPTQYTNPTKTTTTTTTKVVRLYRNSLKLVSSWCIDRDIFNDKATEIRGQFDDERGCRPEKAIRLLRVSYIKYVCVL